jgi:hemoglobin
MLLSACNTASLSRENDNLYVALGGEVGVQRIADQFIMEIAYDERVFHFFADSNVERFRQKIIEHFCVIADGPCEYTGDDMVQVHTGMGINVAEFNAVVEDLIRAMDQVGTPIAAQNRLLARLAALRPEIMGI